MTRTIGIEPILLDNERILVIIAALMYLTYVKDKTNSKNNLMNSYGPW